MKLSAIIPLYNTNIDYFKQCLQSLAQSSIAKRNELEVIIVNDGSIVDYGEIERSYPQFHIFYTENKGTLCARLYGIEKSSGEYITFVDSDDMLTFDYHEAMLRTAEQTGADIVINDWAFWTSHSKYVCSNDTTINSDFLLDGKDVLTKFFSSCGTEHSYYVLWNKLFRRETILQAKESIDALNLPKMVYAEDTLTSFFAFCHAKKIVNTHSGYYFYRIHNDQQIYVTDQNKFINQVRSMANVFSIMEKQLKNINRYHDLCTMLAKWKNIMISSQIAIAKHSHFQNMRDEIMSIYSVDKIYPLPSNLQKVYEKHKLLPCNLDEIERLIKQIVFDLPSSTIYAKKKSYAMLRLNSLCKAFDLRLSISNDKKNSELTFPREIYPMKLRIIHNRFIYKIGMLLFPKGSKIRKLLKSKI